MHSFTLVYSCAIWHHTRTHTYSSFFAFIAYSSKFKLIWQRIEGHATATIWQTPFPNYYYIQNVSFIMPIAIPCNSRMLIRIWAKMTTNNKMSTGLTLLSPTHTNTRTFNKHKFAFEIVYWKKETVDFSRCATAIITTSEVIWQCAAVTV